MKCLTSGVMALQLDNIQEIGIVAEVRFGLDESLGK